MKLVHLSDLHLGFRRYEKTTRRGVNQREVDVATSFTRAIDQTIALAPDLVVIGGDIFHVTHPTNAAAVHAYDGFARLRRALPATDVLMVAGNHDTPRSADMGGPLKLAARLGIHVVDGAPRVVDLPALDCAVLCVPDTRSSIQCELVPVGDRRYNVLLLHGEAGGISPVFAGAGKHELTDDELHVTAWDYIALGHYHVYRECAPNMFYSGAIDYTSSDVWGELAEEATLGLPGKGIIEHDLSTGAHTFHPLPTSRVIVDLEPIDAAGLMPADVDALITERVASIGGVTDKVVRQKVRNMTRIAARELDHKHLRRLRAAAMNFHLVCEPPDAETPLQRHVRVNARGRRPLTDVVREMLEERALSAGVDRAEFVALGMRFLGDQDDLDDAPVQDSAERAA